ncbi:TPA: hypothetical protein DDY56_03480 [Candidatus Uhrbacteria bacterium]|nr:hypothetical protein [Candidatus Uhrbacteria bacterium]HBJ62648.1 hypothetical protein [Candidatus Uhrbacteria bacterium]
MMIDPITSGQKRQIKGFGEIAFEAVLDELGFSKKTAQRVVMGGAACQELLKEHFRSVLTQLASPQEFADEEVESSYGYLSRDRQPRSVTEQANRLREIFQGIGYANEMLANLPVLNGAEGKFVIPPWQKVAATYGEAVQIMLGKLRVECGEKFVNYIEDKLGAKHLREGIAKKAALRKLAKEQKGFDLLVVDGQFGFLHRGRSVRHARVVMQDGGQFGFGAFENGIMILTHPDRLKKYGDLWLDCAGDEYSHEAVGQFPSAPLFVFLDGNLRLDTRDIARPYGHCGSSSGFSLQ